jgi:hypothetical protein
MTKKLFLGIVFIAVVFNSCSSYPSAQYAMKTLYSTVETTRQTVEGNFLQDEFIIYKKLVNLGSSYHSITLSINSVDGVIMNSEFILRVGGPDWLFPSNLSVKIDEINLNLQPYRQSRDVVKAGWVEEIYLFRIDTNILNSLKNVNIFRMQFIRDQVIDLDEEGRQELSNFIAKYLN